MFGSVRGLLVHETPEVISFVRSLGLTICYDADPRIIVVSILLNRLLASITDDLLTPHRAGKPNPETFPFESITLHLKPPLNSTPDDSDIPSSITIEGPEINAALQYGPTPGLTPFRGWLEDLQKRVHRRHNDRGDWTVSIGTGSQDLMYKVANPTGRKSDVDENQGVHGGVESGRSGAA